MKERLVTDMPEAQPKGFKGIFRFILFLIKKIKDDDVFAVGSQIAYSLIVSIFPFIIFLMTLIGRSNLEEEVVLGYLSSMLPGSAYALIESTVLEVLSGESIGLLSFALIFAIWSASRGIAAIIKGLNKAYDEREKRGFIELTIVSFISTIGFALAILLVLIFFVLGDVIKNTILQYLSEEELIATIWQILRYTFSIAIIIGTFAILYHFAPSKHLGWIEVLPGAITAAVGWIIASVGFSFYVNNFANYSRFYGSLGAIIVLLTWLYLSSVIILIGGEINALMSKKVKL